MGTDARPPAATPPGSAASATAGGLTALAVWSSSVAVIRGMSESVGTLTAAALAAGLGGIVSLLYAWRRGQSPGKMLRLPRAYLLGCGGLFVACSMTIYLAVGWASDRSTTLVVGLVNYLWPALTVALSVPILRRRARWYLPLGCIVAVAGTGVAILGGGQFSWSQFSRQGPAAAGPLALAAVSAVSWALYSNLARRWGSPQGGAAPLFVLATACGLGLLRLLRPETTCWSLKGALEVAFMGVVSQGMAYNLWDHGMRRGNHVLLSLSSYFVPVASLLLASVYLAVVPHASVLIGCALVVAGAVICLMSLEASTP